MPEGLWTKCQNCQEIIYSKEIERNWNVCPKCDYHFRITAQERIDLVLDKDSFVEMDAGLKSKGFPGLQGLQKIQGPDQRPRLKKGPSTKRLSAVKGPLMNFPVVVAVLDFGYMGGSMGVGGRGKNHPGH